MCGITRKNNKISYKYELDLFISCIIIDITCLLIVFLIMPLIYEKSDTIIHD